MSVRRWHEEPVEELTPSIGRQVVHTEAMTIALIHLRCRRRRAAPRASARAGRDRARGPPTIRRRREEQVVSAGESMFVPSGVPHEVEALADSVVLDVFSPVRDDWVRGDDAYLRGRSD